MRLLMLALAAVLATAVPAAAHPNPNGLSLPLGGPGERTAASAAQAQPQPPTVPRPDCGPGSRPETDIQGRVPAGNPEGFTCNTTLVGHHGSSGGYKALRFTDKAGHECAYYDTTLLFPSNAQTLSERPTGVAVLDMSDPANPKQTTSLLTPAMQTPHESLLLNERRGLLAAVTGNPAFYPGIVDLYDLNEDCRSPQLQSSLPVGIFGHESGFAPDGNTFYATSIGTGNITAVDVSNPKLPTIVAGTNYNSHGLTISDDGNRAYVAASQGLFILDTSEIQARKPGAQFKEISKLDWPERTIPQVAQPITIGGRPYLAEIDEFSSAEDDDSVAANGPKVGAARIIDIADERNPQVVSNIRLAVHQRENRAAIANDPGAQFIVQGYAGHYCNVPRRNDPEILACSMIASGLRIFDIRDPRNPREMAYYVAANKTSQTAGAPSNYAMSSPAFVPERSEVWYADGNSGFYNVKLAGWPFAAGGAAGAASGDCTGDAGFRSVSAKPLGRRVRLGFTRRKSGAVKIEVFQVSQGRRIVKERRVARFRKPATWSGRGPDGYYFARFTMAGRDVRRIVLRKQNGRFKKAARHYRRGDCQLLRSYKLERPVFGGRQGTPLRVAFRLTRATRVRLELLRGSRVVARRTANAAANRTVRVVLRPRKRGVYRVRISVGTVTSTLTARRL
ncbi:MAG TPA: hypothetical protein VKB28_07285 [Solirubrobacteraceae bacterium]|nr:hypothetical protein [Solirubrobacteraceae bacterium]